MRTCVSLESAGVLKVSSWRRGSSCSRLISFAGPTAPAACAGSSARRCAASNGDMCVLKARGRVLCAAVRCRGTALVVLALAFSAAVPASAAPPRLSRDHARSNISSTYGSGAFGRWFVDRFRLPAYRYDVNEDTTPFAQQPELNGSTAAWHQLGNDHIVANGYNHGYVQLWSQDRRYQWANQFQPERNHFAGGYGYLNVGGHVISTLHSDLPAGASQQREFGAGYARRVTSAEGVRADESVYAPFGDDPVLLHDVRITNTSSSPKDVSWFEFWDVNPVQQGTKASIATSMPSYDSGRRTLSIAQLPNDEDTDPLSIYAAALKGPDGGYTTNALTFFGAGGRAAPSAAVTDSLASTVAGAPRGSLFAFRAPLKLAPGESVTLRYAYGMAHAAAIPTIVDRYRATPDPLRTSEAAWRQWLPQGNRDPRKPWIARELQWDAYTLRSGATYEDCAGRHIISQGGYYQYDMSFQGAFRDPLQHMLPLIYADRPLARDVLVYSAQEQPSVAGQIPYALIEGCRRFDLGSSDDLDLWLLWAAAEYGLASRDLSFFDKPVRYSDGTTGSMWEHLKLAFQHQESQLGPHGGYVTGGTGDWSDFSTQFLQMTESTLVSAQTAYVYPRLASLADAVGDRSFAAELRRSGARDRATERREWTGRGWWSRGYAGERQIGSGAVCGEPQPWGLLARAASRSQARRVVANVRRFLTGVGAPPEVHGRARIGSSQTPAADDPDVTEHSDPPRTIGGNGAVYVGGTWFAVNGWLTWALASVDGIVPHAASYALDEFSRNTLAAHAHAFPRHWDGVLSVDDVCNSFHASDDPAKCGNGLSTSYEGQIMHQPAWSLYDATKLAGVEPTAAGYTFDPHLPGARLSLRFPDVGVAYSRRRARGYLVLSRSRTIRVSVRPPRGVRVRRAVTWVGGTRVRHTRRGGLITFRLRGRAGAAVDWAVVSRRR